MKTSKPITLVAAVAAASFALSTTADEKSQSLRTRLSGFNEVHFVGGTAPALRGAISTPATGRFTAHLDERGEAIDYTLSYEDLRAPVTQAHIHFGQKHTVGGIVVWLCQTAGTPAPASVAAVTPMCPASGEVSGTIRAAQVLAQTAQGFDGGTLEELLRAIRGGAAYVNVHSQLFGPGEIRGHLDPRGHDHD